MGNPNIDKTLINIGDAAQAVRNSWEQADHGSGEFYGFAEDKKTISQVIEQFSQAFGESGLRHFVEFNRDKPDVLHPNLRPDADFEAAPAADLNSSIKGLGKAFSELDKAMDQIPRHESTDHLLDEQTRTNVMKGLRLAMKKGLGEDGFDRFMELATQQLTPPQEATIWIDEIQQPSTSTTTQRRR